MANEFGVVSIPNLKRIQLYQFLKCLPSDAIVFCEPGYHPFFRLFCFQQGSIPAGKSVEFIDSLPWYAAKNMKKHEK